MCLHIHMICVYRFGHARLAVYVTIEVVCYTHICEHELVCVRERMREKTMFMTQLVWLSRLSAGLQTEKLLV